MSCKSASFSLNARPVTALLPQIADPSRRELDEPRPLSRSARVTHRQLGGRLATLGVTTNNHSLATSKDGRCNPKPIAYDHRFPRARVRGESVAISALQSPNYRAGRRSSRGARANRASVPGDGPAGAPPPSGRALPHSCRGTVRVLGGQRKAVSDHRQSGHPLPANARCFCAGLPATPTLTTHTEAGLYRRGPLWRFVRPLNGGARGAARPVLLTQFLPNQTLVVVDDD